MAHLKPAPDTLHNWLTRALESARDSRTLARTAAGALGALTPLAALANPTGGQVVAGSAAISNPSANSTVINQSSQRAIINWQQFSVGNNQYVQFIQPNSSSVVLNRVVGGNASAIFGNITANGQVFLVNTNGIYFARGATLDAQGFVGSTLDIRNGDFMQGRYSFVKGSGAPDASVVNDGAITADHKGYVVLAGDYVQNDGSINALSGRVVLAAGNGAQLTLDRNSLISYVVNGATLARLAGVSNTGQITADGGAVLMTADVANALTATAVNNSGFVAARSLHDEAGVIVLSAAGGDIQNSGTLDASAVGNNVTGGTVVIRGDGHTQLDPTSVIDTSGNGGAKGGFIELSGHTLGLRGAVTAGRGGNLLIDPATINIVTGSFAGAVTTSINSIGTGYIANHLNAGSNVTIVASNSIANLAGIQTITATNALAAGATLKIAIGTVSCPTGICVGTSPIVTPGNGTINLMGLTFNIKSAFSASAGNGTVTIGDITAKSVSVTGDFITVGNVITSGSTGISLIASHGSNATQIDTGALTTTGGGNVVLTTRANADGNITVNGAVNAAGAFQVSASVNGGGGGDVTLNSAATAKRIQISTFATNGGANVVTHALHATGPAANGGVTINAIESSSAFSSGQIMVTGGIISDNGSVSLNAQGGGDSGGAMTSVTGNITAAKGVDIQAHYIGSSTSGGGPEVTLSNVTGQFVHINTFGAKGAFIHVNNLTATGIGTGATTNDVAVILHNGGGGSASGGSITVNGNINANGNVALNAANGSINANASGKTIKGGGNVTLSARHVAMGSISAGGNLNVDAFSNASSSSGLASIVANSGTLLKGKNVSVSMFSQYGGAIQLADATATGLGASSGVNVSGSGSFSRSSFNITTGNLTAARNVNVHEAGLSGSLHVGNVTAPRISMFLDAKGNIVTGNLTAVSNAGPAMVNVTAFAPSLGNSVKVNGNIVATGVAGNGAFSSAMPGSFGMPVAAVVNIGASGSNNVAHDVTITGNVTVTGVGHAFNHTSANEAGPTTHTTGFGGQATFRIHADGSSGSAKVGGAISVTGPDAHVQASGKIISVHNVTVTGQGHNIVRTITGGGFSSSTGTYSSHNSAGQATVEMGGAGSYGGTLKLSVGNISVSGKGVADVALSGSSVTAGNIAATAAAAKGSVKVTGNIGNALCRSSCSGAISGAFYFGVNGVHLGSGSLNAGRADVTIGAGFGSPHSRPGNAQHISVGTVAVSGVGAAHIELAGDNMQTKGLSATATKGMMKGTGTSGSSLGTLFAHTFDINGGDAGISLDGGSSGGGVVSVSGNVTVKGPGAGVNVTGHKINISGGVQAAASGGSVTSDMVATGNSNYHTHFVGPGAVTGVTLGAGSGSASSIKVGGAVSVTGKGLVGVDIQGNKVTLGGLSASASAAANYTVLDTRVSTTTQAFTLGSVVAIVSEEQGGSISGPVTITGNATLTAKAGSVYLPVDWKVGGKLVVNAAGDVTADVSSIAPRFDQIGNVIDAGRHGGGSSGSPAISTAINIGANSATMVAGSSIDLTGAAVTAAQAVILTAAKHILVGGADISAGGSLALTANGSISNGGSAGTLTGKGGMHLSAMTGAVSLAGETLNAGGATALVSAAGGITLTSDTVTAGGFGAAAGGSVDLTGATVTVTGTTQLVAGFNGKGNPLKAKDIILSGVNITTGVFDASAGGNIHNGGGPGTITAGALLVEAGGDVNLSSTDITVKAGHVPGVNSDAVLDAGLGALGIAPNSAAPNATFIAGGSLTLGQLTMTGDYLSLQASSISLLGPVSLPAHALVQVAPIDPTVGIGIEDAPANTAAFNLSNQDFLSLFSGDTVVVGNFLETGTVDIGANGTFDLTGGTNLLIYTTGNVTGLDNVTTTGIVAQLITQAATPPPTAGEIDPNSGGTGTTAIIKKKNGQSIAVNVDTGDKGGTISQDTGTTSVCH